MDTLISVQLLSGLAQPARLNIFRLLIEAGEAGLSAGVIGERLALPNSTLSFHLKTLQHAGLIVPRPNSRFIYYAANFSQMTQLVQFLTAHCCRGETCDLTDMAAIPSCDAPILAPASSSSPSKTAPQSTPLAIKPGTSAAGEIADCRGESLD